MGLIYKISYNNQPIYIGQTTKTLKERWREHKNTSKDKGFAIHAAMRKYGIENFQIETIEEVDNSLLNEKEKFWIKKLHTHISEQGYNLTYGGEFRPEYVKTPCYQYNIEGKFIQGFESISEAARVTQGHHENILKVLQNKSNTAYGFRWSLLKVDQLEPLKNNYTGASKIIYQYDLQGNFIQSYESSKAAARALNKSQGNISSAANGKRKSAYGFLWSYDYIMQKAGY